MPKSRSLTSQHAIGGAVGVLLLVFALVYRFFPEAIKVEPALLKSHPAVVANAPTQTLEVPRKATSAESELNAGPPISLAPAAVIAARAREGSFAGEGAGKGKVAQLLADAGDAARAGNLTGTGADSAVSLVLEAVKQAPDDAQVKRAVSLLHARLVANAQQSLSTGDADSARASLDALRQLPGSHEDLASLSARVEAAGKVQPLLEQASELVQKGKLEGPGDDSALAVYRQVLALDPENVVARQGLQRVQQAALDRALSAAAQNDDAKADAALADAAAILPSSPALTDARERVAALRSGRAGNLMAQAESAYDAGNFTLAQTLAGQAGTLGAATSTFLDKVHNALEYSSFHPGQVFSDHFLDIIGQAPAMVVIPRGSFLMGASQHGRESSAEQPQHEVTFARGFAMARAEVTVAEFRAFVQSSGYVPDSDRLGGASVYDDANGRMQMRSGVDWQDDYSGQRAKANDPVVNVSWNDANAYAAWLARHTGKPYRLPTEAEYEYAERGGTTTLYWWGDGTPKSRVENLTGSGDQSPTGRKWDNFFKGYGDGYWGPAPVMSFEPNPFGLYDIDGNVSEWVEDCWHDNYVRAPGNGSAWVNPGCADRVIRGGSWGSAPDQDRSSFRLSAPADSRSGRVGFRVARDL